MGKWPRMELTHRLKPLTIKVRAIKHHLPLSDRGITKSSKHLILARVGLPVTKLPHVGEGDGEQMWRQGGRGKSPFRH